MHRILTYAILALTLCLSSCTKRNMTGVSDNDTKEYKLYDYYEDAYGNKGIVGYIHDEEDEDGDLLRYTIVLSLDETVTTWGPMGTTVFDVNSNFNEHYPDNLFFGLDMNQRVWNLGAERFPAFDWCFKKNGNEAAIHSSSWILPTYAELGWIFSYGAGQNLEKFNKHIAQYGGTCIDTEISLENCYWSCVEDLDGVLVFESEETQNESDYDPSRRAIPMTIDSRFYIDKLLWHKNKEYHVRAIKYIYFASSPD